LSKLANQREIAQNLGWFSFFFGGESGWGGVRILAARQVGFIEEFLKSSSQAGRPIVPKAGYQ